MVISLPIAQSATTITTVSISTVFSGWCHGNTIAHGTIRANAQHGTYLFQADSNRLDGNDLTGQIGSSSYGP